MPWGCFAASGFGSLKKVNAIKEKGGLSPNSSENLKQSAEDWVLDAVRCSNRTVIQNSYNT